MKLWGTARWWTHEYDGREDLSGWIAPWYTELDPRMVCNEQWYCAQCGSVWASVDLTPDPGKYMFHRTDCVNHERSIIRLYPGQLLNTECLTASAPRSILIRELEILAQRQGYLWPNMITC